MKQKTTILIFFLTTDNESLCANIFTDTYIVFLLFS